MWAELSANVPNARNMRPSSTTSKTVTISPDDVAKIRKDAKNTISFNLSLYSSSTTVIPAPPNCTCSS